MDLAYRVTVDTAHAKAELSAFDREAMKSSKSMKDLDKAVADAEKRIKEKSKSTQTLTQKLEETTVQVWSLTAAEKAEIQAGTAMGLSHKAIAEHLKREEAEIRLYTKQLQDVEAQQRAAAGSSDKLRASLAAIGAVAGAAGAASIKLAVDLNRGMANIATIVPDNTARINEFKAAIQDMAVTTGKSTGDLAGGMYEIQSSIGDTADVLKILEINARAGAAGMSSTKEAIAFTSAVTKTYGDTSAEAFQKVADLGFQAVNLGATTFPELAASIGTVAPIAKETGVSMEEMFAVIATASGVTGNTSQVMTQMSAAIAALVSPSTELKAIYNDLGVASGEALIKQHGLVGSLQLVAKAAKEADLPLIDLLGRKEAWVIASSLAGAQAEKFSKNLVEMGNVAGATDRAFRQQTEGVNAAGFAYEQLKQTIVTSMQQAGDAVLQNLPPSLGAVVVGMSEVSGSAVSMAGEIAQVVIAVQLLSGGRGLAGLTALFVPTVAGLKDVTTATYALSTAQGVAAGSSVTLAARMGALALVFGKFAAVAATFYGIKELAKHFDAVRIVLENSQNPFAAAVAGWANWEKEAKKAATTTETSTRALQGHIRLMASHGSTVDEATRKQRTLVSQLQETQKQVANLTAAQRAEIQAGDAMNLSAQEIAETMNVMVPRALQVSEEAVKMYIESLKESEQAHKKAEAAAKKHAEETVKFNKAMHDSVLASTKDIQEAEAKRVKEEIQNAERSTEAIVDALAIKVEAEENAAATLRELNMSELEFKLDMIHREGEARKKALNLTTELGRQAAAAVEADMAASMNAILAQAEEVQLVLATLAAAMPGVYGGFAGMGDFGSIPTSESGSGRRPGRGTYGRWAQQWQQQYADFSSWGSGVNSGMNLFQTYGPAAEDIATGDTQVLRATNVAGRGNRAWRGALAGAQEGGQYGGPWGAAGGAVAGLIIGLVRNPGFEDVMNRLSHQFGEGISEELARNINDLADANENRGWGRHEAETRSMGAVIGEIGVDDKNIDRLIARTRDLFVHFAEGRFTVEEARATLDETFGAFAEHVVNSERLASKGFQELIALNKQYGLESEQVKAFVESQTGALGGSIAMMAGPLVEQYGGLADAIALADEEVKRLAADGREGSQEYTDAVADLTALQEKQAAGASGAAAEIERLGVIAVGAFNASREAGTDMLTAVDAMGPAIDTLIGLQRDLGITSENAALQELVAFRDRVNNNRTLVASTEALGETMRALTSIGGLNVDTLRAMEEQGLATFQRLTEAGFSENEALTMMSGFLENVLEAHAQLGTPIDANTQRLIDQAKAAGLLKKEGTDMVSVFKEGFGALIEAVGGEIPQEWLKIEGASQDAQTQVAADASAMAGSVDSVTDAVNTTEQQLRDTEPWRVWRDAGVDAANDVFEAVNAVSFGHSPGGLKEIPLKLQEAIRVAHEFKAKTSADMAAVEAAVNSLSGEQRDALRLLIEVGRPLQEIADVMDLSTAAVDRFIQKEQEAAKAAEEAKRAMEQQRLEAERMAETLSQINLRARDDLSLLGASGLPRDLMQLDFQQRDEIAAVEAMRPVLGAVVDETIALIVEKFDILREQARQDAAEESARALQEQADQARQLREEMAERAARDLEQYTSLALRLKDQISLIGKEGIERELLELQYARRDELARIKEMNAALTAFQYQSLIAAVMQKYDLLEQQAREQEAARIAEEAMRNAARASGAMRGGYVGANGVQYLGTGGMVLGFKPSGSDTVPAMLTPGEGVVSRRGMRALGDLNRGESGSGEIRIIFEKGSIVGTNADDIAEEVADKVMRRLNQRRKVGA